MKSLVADQMPLTPDRDTWSVGVVHLLLTTSLTSGSSGPPDVTVWGVAPGQQGNAEITNEFTKTGRKETGNRKASNRGYLRHVCPQVCTLGKCRNPKGVTMPGRRIQVGKANAAILDGTADLSLWDEEELLRGQRKSRNGKFQGSPPKMVPKKIHDELVKRKLSRAYELLNESIVDAVLVLREVVTDDEADYSDRIKAATLIWTVSWAVRRSASLLKANRRGPLPCETLWSSRQTVNVVESSHSNLARTTSLTLT